jgi:hypothetical protein
VETNQVLGLAPSGSAAQVTPTSPEILPAEIPEGRMGATAGAVGNSALLPMIVIYFHCSTIPIRKIKLTASKMSRAALATVDSGKRVPRERRGDVSALGGCMSVGVGKVVIGKVGIGRVGVGGPGEEHRQLQEWQR